MKRLLLVLSALLCAAAFTLAALAQRQGCGIFIKLEDAVTAEQVARIRDREAEQPTGVGFCFYTIQSGERLTCPDNGRSAEVTAVPVFGNGGLLGADALSWRDGCVLSRDIARSVLGTDRAGAQQVVLGAEPRQALASVSTVTHTAFVSAGEEKLDEVVLAGWDGNGEQAARQFLLRHGLSGRILNFYPLLVFVKNFCLLPLWVLLIRLCRLAGRRGKRLGWLAALAGLAVLGRCVTVPADAVPDLWSDFSFWGNWLQAQKENLLSVLTWTPVDRALQMEQNMVKSMLCAMAGTMAAAIGGRR